MISDFAFLALQMAKVVLFCAALYAGTYVMLAI